MHRMEQSNFLTIVTMAYEMDYAEQVEHYLAHTVPVELDAESRRNDPLLKETYDNTSFNRFLRVTLKFSNLLNQGKAFEDPAIFYVDKVKIRGFSFEIRVDRAYGAGHGYYALVSIILSHGKESNNLYVGRLPNVVGTAPSALRKIVMTMINRKMSRYSTTLIDMLCDDRHCTLETITKKLKD